MRPFLVVLIGAFSLAVAANAAKVGKKPSEEDLDTAESQSFGYGYGTKVQDQYR